MSKDPKERFRQYVGKESGGDQPKGEGLGRTADRTAQHNLRSKLDLNAVAPAGTQA